MRTRELLVRPILIMAIPYPFIQSRSTHGIWLRLVTLAYGIFLQFVLSAQPNGNKAMPKDTVLLKAYNGTVHNDEVDLIYTTVARKLTATSSDVVYGNDLVKSPVTSPYSAMVGRLSGINSFQSSGQPLLDGASFTLHGRTPIVLIDGVARNLNTIDLEEIESITVLKDALSTAMLGVRGANGAIVIKTKSGSATKQTIAFTAQEGVQQGLGLVKPLDAYNYALLKNEAISNELITNPNYNGVMYSAADLQAFKNGGDSLHPNVDWQSQLFNKNSTISRYNFSVSGGNKNSRYYGSLEQLNQNGFLKTSSANKYSTNNFIKSYLARTSIQLNITSKITAGISLFGRIINTNQPGGIVTDATQGLPNNSLGNGINDIYNSILTTPNNAYKVYNANGSYYGNSNYLSNLQAQSTGSGYNAGYIRDILVDMYLKRTLDEIAKGLWIKAKVSYSSTVNETLSRVKNLVVFTPNATSATGYTQLGTVVTQKNANAILSQGHASYVEFSTGYSHTFKEKHNLDLQALYNIDQSTSRSITDNVNNNNLLPYTIQGTSGRLSYNYDKRYVIEAAFAYNGSNRYPNSNHFKYGFFPSVGAAWNITEEKFAKSIKWLSSLKLYGSYGKSGWDNPGYFVYQQNFNNNSNVYFGNAAASTGTLVQSTLADSSITWEKATKTSVGLQGSLFKGKLGFTVEYYYNKFSDLLQQRGHNTAILGTSYPNENIGKNLYQGFDFMLSWQETIRAFTYFISANATVQNSKVLFADEVTEPYAYMNRTSNTVGRPFGYVATGLFQTQAEINSSPTFLGYKPQPGDIKYKDLNGDGIINQLDQTAIGTDKPFVAFGVNMGFSIKGFDFSALLQGVLNTNLYLPSNGNTYWEFQNGGIGQAYQNSLARWTPTNTNAAYPRVGIGSNTNNQAFSSYWYTKGDYMRLKNLEIGYTLPRKLTSKAKIDALRFFANGLNLITFSGLSNGRDPEVFGTYPIQRVINFGATVKL